MEYNNTKIYAIISATVFVLLIVMVWFAVKKSGVETTDQVSSSTPQIVSSTGATSTSTKTPTTGTVKSPVVTTKPSPMTVTPESDYTKYLNQLADNTNKCDASSKTLYDQLYKALEGSSFKSYYNSKSGLCYMQATGTLRPAYSATTTKVIAFWNITSRSPVAECTDVNGVTFSDSEWKCIDKTTGQSITKTAFNALIYKYTVQ